jgi:hypothetical protein
MVQASLGRKQDPISKITKAERTGGVQVVEHLPNKCKALHLNPSTAKNKNKKSKSELLSYPKKHG